MKRTFSDKVIFYGNLINLFHLVSPCMAFMLYIMKLIKTCKATCMPSTLRVFDLSRREAKQTVHRDVSTLLPDVTFVHTTRINCAGNKIAFLGNDQTGNSDSRLELHVHYIIKI